MKKMILSFLVIAFSADVQATSFKSPQEVTMTFAQLVGKSFGTGNIFLSRLIEPKSFIRFPTVLNDAYQRERWYGPLAVFMLQDLKTYIADKATIAVKGLDKDIMASYEVIAKSFKALIDIIQELSSGYVGTMSESGAIQIASGVCSLQKELNAFKGEVNNQRLQKLAKEFTTAKSKKEAIQVLQGIAGGLLDLVEKTIRDAGRLAQQFGVEQPKCCVASGAVACKVFDFSAGRRPGIMPKLSGQ